VISTTTKNASITSHPLEVPINKLTPYKLLPDADIVYDKYDIVIEGKGHLFFSTNLHFPNNTKTLLTQAKLHFSVMAYGVPFWTVFRPFSMRVCEGFSKEIH
jgi:hypothetical protein